LLSSNDEINQVLAESLRVIHKKMHDSEYKLDIECWLYKQEGHEEINPVSMIFENYRDLPKEIWNKILDLADIHDDFLSELGDGFVVFYEGFDQEIKTRIFQLTKKIPEIHEALLSDIESD